MRRYGVLSYFQLLDNIGLLLGIITQYNMFHNSLFSTVTQITWCIGSKA